MPADIKIYLEKTDKMANLIKILDSKISSLS